MLYFLTMVQIKEKGYINMQDKPLGGVRDIYDLNIDLAGER